MGDYGCNTTSPSTWVPWVESCCGRGVPLPASTSLPNCLLIGDSVTDGLSSIAIDTLKSECQTQVYIGVDAAYEAACWGTHRVVSDRCRVTDRFDWCQFTIVQATDGSTINWDVIVYNEGLHSLWPRVNTSVELEAWAAQLTNWTAVLAQVRMQCSAA